MDSNLPVVQRADYFIKEARKDAGMGRILEFKKGSYSIGNDPVPIGTEFIVYCEGWVKKWVKFGIGCVLDSKIFYAGLGEQVVSRESLGDDDKSQWQPGLDGKPKDPWVLQFMLPFEYRDNGDIVTFRTSSFFGKQACADLVLDYGNKGKRDGFQNPIVKIKVAYVPMKKYGQIAKPDFSIVGWESSDRVSVIDKAAVENENDLRDEIPF